MDLIAFWAVSLLLGALALPIAMVLFRRLPDAGVALAIPLGVVLTAYAYFILRVIGVVPYGRAGFVAGPVALLLVSALFARRDRRFRSSLRRALPASVSVVGLFTMLFFGFVAYRAYVSEIGGTEQPMDFLYLNTALFSKDYPPEDPWLSGHDASYYYFGYVQVAELTALSNVPASTGYNLGLGYVFAAAGTAAASLAFAFVRWTLGARGRPWAFLAGGTAVVLLLFIGSLSAPFEWSAAHGNTNRGLYEAAGLEWMIPCPPGARAADSPECYTGAVNPRTTEWYPTEFWFWWRGSRIIPNTITEYPFFSFLLGDLHPHVMSIPLVMLVLALAMSVWRGRSALEWRTHGGAALEGVVVALLFGALAFTNAWDVLTFSGLFGVVVFARNLRARPFLSALAATASYLGPLAALGYLAYLPWWLTFTSQADGLFPYIGAGTRPAHAVLQFGVLFAGSALLLLQFRGGSDRSRGFDTALNTLWVPLAPLLLWITLALVRGELKDAVDARGSGGWVTLAVYAAFTWVLATMFVTLARERGRAGAPAALGLVAAFGALGGLLSYGAELFYIGDVFRGVTPRLNTIFKLGYQAWMLLALAGAVGLALALRSAFAERRRVGFLAVPAAAVLLVALVYPVLAIANRTDGLTRRTDIDGLAFLARDRPDEYALIRWMETHVLPGEVVVEASGRQWRPDGQGRHALTQGPGIDYGEPGRISSRTGRPAPVGWPGHELQWRGDSPETQALIASRSDLVDRAYIASNPEEALAALRALDARYVVVGPLERSRYGLDPSPNLAVALVLRWQSGDVVLYEVPRPGVARRS